jgi:TPR repeat protein
MKALAASLIALTLALCAAPPALSMQPLPDYESFENLRSQASRGDKDAALRLAQTFEWGSAVASQDLDRAIHWYRVAADQGMPEARDALIRMAGKDNIRAQFHLVGLYRNSRWFKRDDGEADAWLGKIAEAAQRGDAVAQNALGELYAAHDRGVTQNNAQALAWFRKAAEQGSAQAQDNLGAMFMNGQGVARDDAQAAFWFRKAAEQDFAAAQFHLGAMFENGQGVAQDEAQAVAWYRKSAGFGQNYPEAQNALGLINDQEAADLYREAAQEGHAGARNNLQALLQNIRRRAEQGDPDAQFDLGAKYSYLTGYTDLLPRDYMQAAFWLRKAAEQGHVRAQVGLGAAYAAGRGVARDDAQAVVWFLKAAAQGSTVAQRELGWMHENGFGVPKDTAQALGWYRKSAAQGSPQAPLDLMRLDEQGIR